MNHIVQIVLKKIMNPKLEEQKNKCKTHQKVIEYFCFGCNGQLCPICVLTFHKDHKFEEIEEAGRKIKQNIFDKLDLEKKKKEIMNKKNNNQK